MSDSSEPLDVARLLSTEGAQTRLTDAEPRRAVSAVTMLCFTRFRGPPHSGSLGPTTVRAEVRDFAEAFPGLQDARHVADYDPATRFLVSNVSSLIDRADAAMAAFDRVAPQEQTDVLALMMVQGRH